MNNRRIFAVAVISIMCAVLLSSFAVMRSTAQNMNMDELIGSWEAAVTVESQGVTFPALLTFGAGGTLIADEPGLPNETSGHGNWVISDDNEIAYTFVALYSAGDGVYDGRLKVVGTLEFEDGMAGGQGPFMIDVFDAGDQVVFSDTGTVDVARIAVESMN